MDEYINRAELISDLKDLPEQERIEYMGIYDCIKCQHAADVVEVVRCNYCKDNATGCVSKGTIWCVRYHARRPIDGYCSYGKRKEGDDNA